MTTRLPTGGNVFNTCSNTATFTSKSKIEKLSIKNNLSFFGVENSPQQSTEYDIDSILNLLTNYGLSSGGVWKNTSGPYNGSGSTKNVLINDIVDTFKPCIKISADGNTLVYSGNSSDTNVGAIWIFTRLDTQWIQQAGPIVGTGDVRQGMSVDISADGNNIVIGGPGLDGDSGNIWIYTRINSVWSLQAGPLSGTSNTGSNMGISVSMSSDGNTVVAGGHKYSGGVGGFWVFTRAGISWSSVGPFQGSGFSGTSNQGYSVGISGDGNTIAVGGPLDTTVGAVWIFINDGGWVQQGSKISSELVIGTNKTVLQGFSVALSYDGNTLVYGGPCNHIISENAQPLFSIGKGASWVYKRESNIWVYNSGPLIPTGVEGVANVGNSVDITSDGETFIIGGFINKYCCGAAWIYKQSNGVFIQDSVKLHEIVSSKNLLGISVGISDVETSVVCTDNTNVPSEFYFFTKEN